MKCPSCNQKITIKVPPPFAKPADVSCPVCKAPLVWKRNWMRGLLYAVIFGAICYGFSMIKFIGDSQEFRVIHIAFAALGIVMGIITGSRVLGKE